MRRKRRQGFLLRQHTLVTAASIYLEQITDALKKMPQVRYWIGDGYFARVHVFNKLDANEPHLITTLRSDANLRFVFAAEKRNWCYGSKVRLDNIYFPTGVVPTSPE